MTAEQYAETEPTVIPTRGEINTMGLARLAASRAELTEAVQRVQFVMDARKNDFLSTWHSDTERQDYYAWMRRAKGFRMKVQNALTQVRAREKALNIAVNETKAKAFANAEVAWFAWAEKYDYDADDGKLRDAFIAGWKNGYAACMDLERVS